ncbi:hypothetical protein Tco_0082424, partial [Tanacetum coccineum]
DRTYGRAYLADPILGAVTEDKSSDSDVEREGHGLEDEGPSSEEEEEEEATPEGQQQVVPVVDTTVDEPLGQSSRSVPEHEGAERISAFRQPTLATWVDPEDGRVYTDISAYVPPVAPVQTPPSPEWSSGSLPVSTSSPVVSSPIASPVATPTATISRLDTLPPTLFGGYARDFGELYTRSWEVRDEIFSQRYRLRSLEQEKEKAIVIFRAL